MFCEQNAKVVWFLIEPIHTYTSVARGQYARGFASAVQSRLVRKSRFSIADAHLAERKAPAIEIWWIFGSTSVTLNTAWLIGISSFSADIAICEYADACIYKIRWKPPIIKYETLFGVCSDICERWVTLHQMNTSERTERFFFVTRTDFRFCIYQRKYLQNLSENLNKRKGESNEIVIFVFARQPVSPK